jgi:4-aminobutyrate aminotransferase-like enzyme
MPRGYLAAAFAHVRAAGGICIADEVQIGFGRMGKCMWGFQACDIIDDNTDSKDINTVVDRFDVVVPDIVTLGKPMGNGFPLAAVITTPTIANAFASTGMEWFNTFGGSTLSCAIGHSVLDVLLKDDHALIKHAHIMSQLLMNRLRKLQLQYSGIIGDIRGCGLFIGIELVTDRVTKTPATTLTQHIIHELVHQYGILLGTDGPYDSVIKVKPPLCITSDDIDYFITSLDLLLSKHSTKSPTSHTSSSDTKTNECRSRL